jgi:hypothetical protein
MEILECLLLHKIVNDRRVAKMLINSGIAHLFIVVSADAVYD